MRFFWFKDLRGIRLKGKLKVQADSRRMYIPQYTHCLISIVHDDLSIIEKIPLQSQAAR